MESVHVYGVKMALGVEHGYDILSWSTDSDRDPTPTTLI